jgi:hypothetical protein
MMAIYNAVTHSIQSERGQTLARLTDAVSTVSAWAVADWWGENSDEIRRLKEDLRSEHDDKLAERSWREQEEAEHVRTRRKLDAAVIRIAELEAELAAAKAEGGAA